MLGYYETAKVWCNTPAAKENWKSRNNRMLELLEDENMERNSYERVTVCETTVNDYFKRITPQGAKPYAGLKEIAKHILTSRIRLFYSHQTGYLCVVISKGVFVAQTGVWAAIDMSGYNINELDFLTYDNKLAQKLDALQAIMFKSMNS